MINVIIIVVGLCLASYLAFSKRLATSSTWRATVTPLASIMGSGFLISAPLLADNAGNYAIWFMAALLVIAYLLGHAVRFNIRHFEPIEHQSRGMAHHLAFLSKIILAFAYFVAVTYYLQLLAAFGLKIFGIDAALDNYITSGLLLFICGVGMWRGLDELEKIETYAVSLNLGMIGALLVALLIHNVNLWTGGEWQLVEMPVEFGFDQLRVFLGLLIIVQGFEISRFIADAHPADERIRTMRYAQWIASAVYLAFIALATVLFQSELGAEVTAIQEIVQPVAVILPLLVMGAAIGSQFSAAVADTSGAGGLTLEIANHRLPMRYVYLLILLVTLFLTWESNVNEIIAYASRAFALFYCLQSLVALIVAYQRRDLTNRKREMALFTLAALICLAVFTFGIPAEA